MSHNLFNLATPLSFGCFTKRTIWSCHTKWSTSPCYYHGFDWCMALKIIQSVEVPTVTLPRQLKNTELILRDWGGLYFSWGQKYKRQLPPEEFKHCFWLANRLSIIRLSVKGIQGWTEIFFGFPSNNGKRINDVLIYTYQPSYNIFKTLKMNAFALMEALWGRFD